MPAHRDISCPTYEQPNSDSRQCKNYVKMGLCSLEGAKHCSEWLKANNRDLLGDRIPAPKRKETKDTGVPEKPPSLLADKEPAQEAVLVRNLTDEEIESFKGLGAEVCISTKNVGDVWIVSEYSESDRQEISVEHAATLSALCSTFPGAKVVDFKSLKKSKD